GTYALSLHDALPILAEPLEKAIRAARARVPDVPARVIYLSPQGAKLDHAKVIELTQLPRLVLLCGRYEAVDERLIRRCVDEELALGDFVLSFGEIAAMSVYDAMLQQ